MSLVQGVSGFSTPVVSTDKGARQLSLQRPAEPARGPADEEAQTMAQQDGGLVSEKVEAAIWAANRVSDLLNARLSFCYHQESGRVYVQVISRESGEVLRQVPPEQMLDLIARVREAVGLIVDEKV
ncbi:MAG: flagellar protein FlaG [Firmicutes bacterium]|nr:flagellar protein FlaG [Bacillota bacterium]